MKYYEVKFIITPYTPDAADVLSAMSAEAGFETFEDNGDGITGYVQQTLFDRQALDEAIENFPSTAQKSHTTSARQKTATGTNSGSKRVSNP